jgi:hypothetical protein
METPDPPIVDSRGIAWQRARRDAERGGKGLAIAASIYLALFAPFGVFFVGDGLPQPYATILGALILYGSWAVGRVVANFWAALLPLIPWVTAVALIYFAPEEGEVGRAGAAILWSVVFVFLTGLVVAGVLSGRRRRSPG